MRLKGRAAIVTGASRGIGKATALTFAREGANVMVNFQRNSEKAEEVAEYIREIGREALPFRADVSRINEVEGMIQAALGRFGRIDILVNNAGITWRKGIQDTSEEEWDRVMAVNLRGVFNCIKAVSKQMIDQRYGKIINISSADGVGVANLRNAAYACSKAGVVQLTKSAALELGKYGINVNCVAPGVTDTDIIRVQRTEEEVKVLFEQIRKLTALERIADPQGIANAILFLASDESSHITAKVLLVDCGRFNFM